MAPLIDLDVKKARNGDSFATNLFRRAGIVAAVAFPLVLWVTSAAAGTIPWAESMGGSLFHDASFGGGSTAWSGNSVLLDFSGQSAPNTAPHRATTNMADFDVSSVAPDITGLSFDIEDQDVPSGYILTVYIVASLANNSTLGYWDLAVRNYPNAVPILATSAAVSPTSLYEFPGALTPVSLNFPYIQAADHWFISLEAYSFPDQRVDGRLTVTNLNWITDNSPENADLALLRPTQVVPEPSAFWLLASGLAALGIWRAGSVGKDPKTRV